MITNQQLIDIGFKEILHFTIGNNVTFDLGRDRNLSASGVGTPNEFLYICETDKDDKRKINDLICIHNYDYDGYMTLDKVQGLIDLLKSPKKLKKTF
jgi:hypothetical protein